MTTNMMHACPVCRTTHRARTKTCAACLAHYRAMRLQTLRRRRCARLLLAAAPLLAAAAAVYFMDEGRMEELGAQVREAAERAARRMSGA